MCVIFETRGKSGRRWTVVFDLGSSDENATAALKYAWDLNAKIHKVTHENQT